MQLFCLSFEAFGIKKREKILNDWESRYGEIIDLEIFSKFKKLKGLFLKI